MRTNAIRTAFCLFLFLAVPFTPGGSEPGRGKIVIRGDHNYPPFEYLDNGIPAGFNIDLVREVASVMGMKIEISLGPWSEVRSDLEKGRIDVLAGMYYSADRDRRVDFSVPHIIVSHDLFVLEESPVRALADLGGKRVMVQEGDIMQDYAAENRLPCKIVPVRDVEEIVRRLGRGDGDGALLQRIQAMYYAGRMGFRVKGIGLDIVPQKYCFAVREGDAVLLARLNEGLNVLKVSGRYAQIHEKWFHIYEKGRFDRRVLGYLLAALGVLLVIALAWSWFLRRKVAVRTFALRKELELRRLAEEEIRSLSQFRERIIETANVWINVLDAGKNVVLWNRAAESISGYSKEEVIGNSGIWEALYPDETYRNQILARAQAILEGSSVENLVTRIRRKDGEERFISWNSGNLVDAAGGENGSIAVGLDITERIRMEGRIQESLEEKNTLLREIHHRVKNNLQVISSILNLQEKYLHDSRDAVLFANCRDRIRSMSLVHENIYRSENFARIDMQNFIQALATELVASHRTGENAVDLDLELDPVYLDLDQAIPLSLILNELVTNSLRHAFRRAGGRITVCLKRAGDDNCRVAVSDDGAGLPKKFDLSGASTLGLKLVNALSIQLGAQLSVIPRPGAAFELTFPLKKQND